MMIVMTITALILTAVHSLVQGTLTLADTISRAQRQDSRQHAFTAFCDRLLFSLPASAALNLKTTGTSGQYVASLELYNVPSPFDGLPGRVVTLYTEPAPGGSLQMKLDCRKIEDKDPYASVVLFEDLGSCEWRVYSPALRQWTGVWTEPVEEGAQRLHPPLLELLMNAPGSGDTRRVFWIAPNSTPAFASPPPAAQPPPQQQQPPPPATPVQ